MMGRHLNNGMRFFALLRAAGCDDARSGTGSVERRGGGTLAARGAPKPHSAALPFCWSGANGMAWQSYIAFSSAPDRISSKYVTISSRHK
jgi:hypothetical protein